MPISNNRHFNSPELGSAFANLSQLFAPPSGGDMAGFASAKAKQQEAARLAELFAYAKDPNYDQTRADRMGVLGGLYAPSTSYYSVDQGNLTTRRGQDVTAQTALTTNSADNARMLEQTRLGNTKDITTSLLAPVGENATRFVPPSVAEMFDLPATQGGNISAAQGERVTTPDGRVIEGATKPLSEAEVQGAILQGLSLADQQAVVTGDIPVEQIVAGDGTAQFVRRNDAVGKQAYVNKGAEAKPTNAIAYLKDGTRVPAVQRPGESVWRHAQTDAVLPADISIADLPKAQGSEADIGLGTTANKTSANAIRGAVANSNALIGELDTLIRDNPAATGIAANILGFSQDAKQVIAEFGAKFGDDPNALVSPSDLQGFADRLIPSEPGYNPVYRQARAMMLELAYSNARMNNPSGEVSRFALEREIEALGQSALGNDQGVLAVLDVARNRMKRKLLEADVLDGKAPAPTADDLYDPGATKTPTAGGGIDDLVNKYRSK